jgi:RNA-directed DNA polymerase
LANILLDDLDKELERRGLPFVRYANDFVIFTRSRRAAERVFRSVNRYLTRHLRLVVKETKSRLVEADGVEYLGFVFRGRRATIHVSEKNHAKFKTSHPRADRPRPTKTWVPRASRWTGG